MNAETLLAASSIYARFILGGVFLWAGVAKLRQGATFERALTDFDLLPSLIAPVVARAIPPVELVLGVLLILGIWTRWIAMAALLLLTTFTLAAHVSLIRGKRPGCFCFGDAGNEVGLETIHRNLGLTLLAGIAALSHTTALSVDALFEQGSTLALSLEHSVVAIAFSLIATALWLVIGEVLRYRSHMGRLAERRPNG